MSGAAAGQVWGGCPEVGQEGAGQHPGIAAGGNWREPGKAGAGAGQGPGFTLNPSALVPTSDRHIKHMTSFFEYSSAKWTSWGLGNRFFHPSRSKAYFKKGDYRREG